MNKRKAVISMVGAGILLGGFALSGMLSEGKSKAKKTETEAPAVVVRTVAVKNGDTPATIKITGRVVPTEKIGLFAEVSGVSSYGARPFKAGNAFKKGEVLLRIDSRELASALAAAKSRYMGTLAKVLPDLKLDYPEVFPAWRAYLLNLAEHKPFPPLPAVANDQLKLFLTGRNVYSDYFSIQETQARLSKYVIRAPYAGSVTESAINQGALVRTGQKLGDYMQRGQFEMEASVLVDELPYLETGQKIAFTDVRTDRGYQAKVVRVNDQVDPTSQLVKVYFQLYGKGLKSGLFLEGDLSAYTVPDAATLPTQALVEDGQVFVVENGKAVLRPVEVVKRDADRFIAKGLPEGTEVVIDKKNSAFDGSVVIKM